MFIPVIIFFASATFGSPLVASAPQQSYALTQSSQEVMSALTSIPGEGDAVGPTVGEDTLGEYVKEYFADEPLLADIAWCESTMRHLDKNGNVLRGKVDSDDVGVMQINTRYHAEKAEELGLDLYSLHGNLEYAKYLYDKQGAKPWMSSSTCWGKLAQK